MRIEDEDPGEFIFFGFFYSFLCIRIVIEHINFAANFHTNKELNIDIIVFIINLLQKKRGIRHDKSLF